MDEDEPEPGLLYPHGATSAFNLASLCEPHHHAKTLGAFRLRHLETGAGAGTFEWTTPSGHTYHRDHHGRVSRVIQTGSADHDSEPPF